MQGNDHGNDQEMKKGKLDNLTENFFPFHYMNYMNFMSTK